MGDQEHQWFEVVAVLKVKAADESDAINRVAGAIRHGYKDAPGVYPVGNFDARPTSDPLKQAPRQIGASGDKRALDGERGER